MVHWYLHVDLDAFFASVEQLDHPEYRGKPLIVGGLPEDRRSVVSTASYEARKFGVHSAMPTYQAYRLCPHGIFVHGRMQRYAELSYQIMNIFRDFSPDVEQMSIDEAFIDITGTEKLFGPPEVTAAKIKERVKRETGLTVSVGIASTKYLAKIASGFQKPDGLTYIHKGDELNFMLSLPLNKVWGLGPKTLELLRSKGIKSTREIYEKSYDTLEFLFGKNTAAFLYNVVRGNESEAFNRQTKNHSISAETTFPYDLTDVYTIETELLELAHGVYFRLLKHNQYSRTAFIKIRYDDFSTCTVQETVNRNIMTLDSFFEIIKRLFEKKYDNSRGIRLLGVGFENVDSEEKPYQQDLFENGDEKKLAVEKAILQLEKKHPQIKVKKARTLKAVLLVFLLSLVSLEKVQTEEPQTKVIQKGAGTVLPDKLSPEEETSDSLFEWDLNDQKHVDFSIEGYWAAEVNAGLNINREEVSFAAPVFRQEIELSAMILLNQHWFFQGDFAQEFKHNTYAAGYKDGNYVKLAKLANRGITVQNPKLYSADFFGYSLAGGANQAPGFALQLASPDQRWLADFLVRYDMTSTRSLTFYGMNQVTDQQKAPETFMYGRAFKFPSEAASSLQNIKDIYVESKQGTFFDKNHKRYKKLSVTDYYYSVQKNQLYISSQAGAGQKDVDSTVSQNTKTIPTILITFLHSNEASFIATKTGSYQDAATFAGKIQNQFNSSTTKKYQLEAFSYPLLTQIESKNALVIQNSSGFSPYLITNLYDCGLYETADFSVISASTGKTLTQYAAFETQELFTGLNEDLFKNAHSFTQIINQDFPDSTYPFVQDAPEIYLNLASPTDIKILKRTYSPVTSLNIGTTACAGSVQVYKNNIIDTGAVYNSETGDITLSSPVVHTDKIYITWQEDTSDYSNGSITAGAGLIYHFMPQTDSTPQITTDVLLSVHWPLFFGSKFSTSDDLQRGYAAVSGGIEYNNGNWSLCDKTLIALQKENAAESLLVSTQNEGPAETFYLSSNSGYHTHGDIILNLNNSSIILSESTNCTKSNLSGVQDSNISGYAIPLSWDFSNTQGIVWAAADIKLDSGNLLCNAYALELALKPVFKSADDFNNYDFYIQLGTSASNTFYGEDSSRLVCYKLSLQNKNNAFQTLTLKLSDSDRAKLISNHDLRLIIIPKQGTVYSPTGTIYIGPYEPHIQSIYTTNDPLINVSAGSYPYNSDFYSSAISWQVPATTDPDDLKTTIITASRHFTAADFSNYKTIDFDFYVNAQNPQAFLQSPLEYPALTLILDSPQYNPQSVKFSSQTAVYLELYSIKNCFNDAFSYHTLSIDIQEQTVSIDGTQLEYDTYKLYLAKEVVPSHLYLKLNTVTDNNLYKSGTFHIGNLSFSDSKLFVTGKNYASAKYQKENLMFKVSSTQTVDDFSSPDFNIFSDAAASYQRWDILFKGDLSLQKARLSNAGHSIKTTTPLLQVVELEENYRFNSTENSLSKNDAVSLNFDRFKFPLNLSFSTEARENAQIFSQDSKTALTFEYQNKGYGAGLQSLLKVSQSLTPYSKGFEAPEPENYFFSWYEISTLEFSGGKAEAVKRNCEFESSLSALFPFASFAPKLEYGLYSAYNLSDDTLFTDKESLKLTLPFMFSSNSLSFIISRTASGTSLISYGGDYSTDLQELFSNQQQRTWFYSSVPFYELFDKTHVQDITADYSAKYELLYKRKLFNSYSDLFVPSAASFSVIRDIKGPDSHVQTTSSTLKYRDIYQFKTTITNTSVNNFGSKSRNKLFDWFNQEELITSLSGIVKVPVDLPENTICQISAYGQLILFITDKATLTTALDWSWETDNNWLTRASFIFARPSQTSFPSALIYLFVKDTSRISFDIVRKEVFNLEINKEGGINRQNYSYRHSAELKFLKNYTLTTGIGASLIWVEDTSTTGTIELSLGAKAQF